MQVEIWSDVVCPWCAIGKRRFEAALARFAYRDEVQVRWRSFELDPGAPRERAGELVEQLAAKYGMPRADAEAAQARLTAVAAADGWDLRFERARPGNTFDAHRLLHLAADSGVQDTVGERLFAAYLTEGEPIGDRDALVRLAAEAGLDADEARRVLNGDDYVDAVRADERLAQAFGITGVPFFVIDRRYGVSGAQPAETLLAVLERVRAESRPLTVLGPGSGTEACADGSCAL